MITDDQWFTELAALVIGVRVLPRQAKATGMESPLPCIFAIASRLRFSFITRLALIKNFQSCYAGSTFLRYASDRGPNTLCTIMQVIRALSDFLIEEEVC